MNGLVVLAVVAAAVAVFGAVRWVFDGRVRADSGHALPGVDLGPVATVVQFSSKICSQCHAARRVLTAESEGVTYLDLDVEDHLDLVEQFQITRTPTVLLVDGAGQVRHRVVGVPRPQQVRGALDVMVGQAA